jgi:hypothetical protein
MEKVHLWGVSVAERSDQEGSMYGPTNRNDQQSVHAEGNDQQGTHVSGRKSLLFRAAWLSVVVPALVLFIVALPLRYTQLTHPVGFLRVSLEHMGLPLGFYAVGTLLLESIFVGTYCATAVLLFWRKSSDWMALLVGLFLVVFGLNFPPSLQLLADRQPIANLFVTLLGVLTYICMDGLFFLFPDGRFVPRWTWLMLVAVALLEIPFNLPPSSPFAIGHWNSLLVVSIAVSEFVVPIWAQIYRYRRISDATQRQQTKWVVYGVSVALISVIAVRGLAGLLFPEIGQNSSFNNVADNPFFYTLMLLILLLIPLSFGIAILRSHLWDIDSIINRTLVYGSLTTLLALLYFGLIFALQSLFQGLFHPNNAVAIVVSTLVIVALFQPLHHSIQRFIDRRFYRHKYDAAKTLEAFSATLRNEVDLDQLREHLLEVVQETMQPAHVSLWLRSHERHTEESRRREKPTTMEESF